MAKFLAIYDADPFASAFIDNCMEKGKLLKNGGCQYDVISQSNIGPAVLGNSFAAIKKLFPDSFFVEVSGGEVKRARLP